MMNLVYNWLNSIQECLLPPTCILCGNSGNDGLDLCVSCKQRLARNHSCCPRCGEIFPEIQSIAGLCGGCLQQERSFDSTCAPFIYQDEIRYLITGLKFGKQFKNARLLGLLLAEAIPESAVKPDCLIPVPLHPLRYRERGFNQAVEIAKTAGIALNIQVNTRSCVRLKDTPHQTGLSAKQRRKNLSKAFGVLAPVTARRVAIIDDVMTTGSTAEMLAKALKKAGVERVDVWVCARA